jgi:hypothetical protein
VLDSIHAVSYNNCIQGANDMKYLTLAALLALAACSDTPVLTSPAEVLADRAAHNAYLASKYDPEYLADCEYYEMETCE